MADADKPRTLVEQITASGEVILNADETAALEMLVAAFSDRITALFKNGKLELQLTPESLQEANHPNAKTRERLTTLVTANGFRFANCTPEQLELCLNPAYADVINERLFAQLCMRIMTDFQLSSMPQLTKVLTHPHLKKAHLEEILKTLFGLSPDQIMANPEAVTNFKELLQRILFHSKATPAVIKQIISIPNFVDLVNENDGSEQALVALLTPIRAAGLSKEDIELFLENPSAYRTIVRYLNCVAPKLFSDDLPFSVRWINVKNSLLES